jgi:hypothetical protein
MTIEQEVKYAYAAGIVDGEGCFDIAKCRMAYTPRILVVNTNENIMLWLKENFGGDIQRRKPFKDHPNWKQGFIWRIGNQKALDLSDKIFPYLIIKEKQALIFNSFVEIKKTINLKFRSKFYADLVIELRKLNKKGI